METDSDVEILPAGSEDEKLLEDCEEGQIEVEEGEISHDIDAEEGEIEAEGGQILDEQEVEEGEIVGEDVTQQEEEQESGVLKSRSRSAEIRINKERTDKMRKMIEERQRAEEAEALERSQQAGDEDDDVAQFHDAIESVEEEEVVEESSGKTAPDAD